VGNQLTSDSGNIANERIKRLPDSYKKSEESWDPKNLPSFGCYTRPRPLCHMGCPVDTTSPQLERTPPTTVVVGAPEFIFTVKGRTCPRG